MALPPADPSRRARLNALKLAALVRDHAGEVATEPGEFGAGAALARDGAAWILVDGAPVGPLGAALAWTTARGLDALHLLADDPVVAGRLARRAALVTLPTTIWSIDGRRLVGADPTPLPEPRPVDPRCAGFEDLIVAGGAEPLVEHGVLVGEVDGLEVCRAVIDPFTDEARLEVGVGAHDREAFQLLHGNLPTVAALREVVAYVRTHRTRHQPAHALNRLAIERAVRHRLLGDPGAVGARSLAALAPPEPRTNVKDPTPCFAVGTDGDGAPVVVAVAVGVDLDLPLAGAEARAAYEPGARLVLAVPERDAGPPLRRVAALVRDGAEVRVLAPEPA